MSGQSRSRSIQLKKKNMVFFFDLINEDLLSAQEYIGSASGEQSPVWGGGRGRLPRLRTLPEEDAPPTAPASPASLASLALAPVASPCADKDSYQRASTNFDVPTISV